jgi:hypothetical protein
MCVCWLDEIEDFSFNVTHLPGAWNLADLLMRHGFAEGPGPAALTGDPDQESQLELFSRLGHNKQCPAVLPVLQAGWAANQRVAAVWFAGCQEGDNSPSARPMGGAVSPGVLVCLWPWRGQSWP